MLDAWSTAGGAVLAGNAKSGICGLAGSLGVYLVLDPFLFLYFLSARRLMTSSTTYFGGFHGLTHHWPGITGIEGYGEISET